VTALGEYRVLTSDYRGHMRGEVFEAYIPPGPEQRAIARGAVELLRRVEPTLPPNHDLPHGWGHNEGGK